MKQISLELIKGDTKTWRLEFYNNNEPIPLFGYTVYFTVKVNFNDVVAILQKIIICPNNSESSAGICRIELSTTDTDKNLGTYIYDMKLEKLPDYRETFSQGELNIIPSVT